MVTLKCKAHPKYQGAQPPKGDCSGCWFLWATRDDAEQEWSKTVTVEGV